MKFAILSLTLLAQLITAARNYEAVSTFSSKKRDKSDKFNSNKRTFSSHSSFTHKNYGERYKRSLIFIRIIKQPVVAMNLDVAKVVTIITLGFGSMLMGLLPAALSRYNLRHNQLFQTILLCFGAGILLATSIVHILPEVRKFVRDISTFVAKY